MKTKNLCGTRIESNPTKLKGTWRETKKRGVVLSQPRQLHLNMEKTQGNMLAEIKKIGSL